ncbi:MAG: acetyl/propionyl/methylcrotonyl-CoA carboxylase subunit alpha [Alphaproteobacteria bacterium]|nr:acetyl/propionyl/methylcrotonyl-CoA carboxylase subunit alpha [Alphaproteobacteria bacterium]
MFSKILIANRGEIACRVARTARRMGIRTVAVYSDADAGARHVQACDEAVRIGPAPARESYLVLERIVEAARATGAEAIHPGYGFLSENAGFAEACAAAKLVFIGPPPSAIRAMGSKSAAKSIMGKAGVPLVPGYHGDNQDSTFLAAEAGRVGFPVLIKASAGGGGKGMRIVRAADGFAEALASAQREARSSFGDDRVLIERYLTRPRHIEIQVFADTHGNCVYLFERDCSLQRRHQKVIEEAPAPGMEPERRRAMGEAAVKAARAVAYVGAGTVEMIADEDGTFYFMEMNTRLQVEHPVTEMITGQDLVEWQLRVATGAPLPLGQADLTISGHAFEARIYAEDPARDFLPATGRLHHLRLPADGPHVRVDSGVGPGDVIGIHYDPMIAKLIVWDRDRASALGRLAGALEGTEVVGVATNVAFLAAVARHPAFATAEIDTGFIERHRSDLVPEAQPTDDTALALAALAVMIRRAEEAEAGARRSLDPHSPWHRSDGWRLNDDNQHAICFLDGAMEQRILVHYRPFGYVVDLPSGRRMTVSGTRSAAGEIAADLDGRRLTARIIRLDEAERGESLTVLWNGRAHRLGLHDPMRQAATADARAAGRLTAPMPGKVVQVLVKPGETVARGRALMVLEAMKMEHTITAPADGTVKSVRYASGDLVEEGTELLVIEGVDAS